MVPCRLFIIGKNHVHVETFLDFLRSNTFGVFLSIKLNSLLMLECNCLLKLQFCVAAC